MEWMKKPLNSFETKPQRGSFFLVLVYSVAISFLFWSLALSLETLSLSLVVW